MPPLGVVLLMGKALVQSGLEMCSALEEKTASLTVTEVVAHVLIMKMSVSYVQVSEDVHV